MRSAVEGRDDLPRMADYAAVLMALDRARGLDPDAGHYGAYLRAVDPRNRHTDVTVVTLPGPQPGGPTEPERNPNP